MKSKPKTQAQIAAEIGVTRRTLSTWRQGGMDTTEGNIQALRNKANTSQSRGKLSEKILKARLRKLTAEAAAKEHSLEVERGHFVTKESQEREGLQIGQTIKQLILKIPAELPQALVGLEYPAAVKKCEDFAHHILTEIHEFNPRKTPENPDEIEKN